MVDISDRELIAIADYQTGSEIIAIRKNAPAGQKVCKIQRNELTCFELLKHFFGFGKYANYDFYLTDVSTYLSQFDWKDISVSGRKDAYYNACELGNKALFHKGKKELFDRVSVTIPNKQVDYKLFQRKSCTTTFIEDGVTKTKWHYTSWDLSSQHKVTKELKWNQAMQSKHVKKYILSLFNNKNFDSTMVALTHPLNLTKFQDDHFVSYSDLENMNVEVTQKQTIKIDHNNVIIKPDHINDATDETVVIIENRY